MSYEQHDAMDKTGTLWSLRLMESELKKRLVQALASEGNSYAERTEAIIGEHTADSNAGAGLNEQATAEIRRRMEALSIDPKAKCHFRGARVWHLSHPDADQNDDTSWGTEDFRRIYTLGEQLEWEKPDLTRPLGIFKQSAEELLSMQQNSVKNVRNLIFGST
ncbi:unnamed protein product [Zymoseptoria tritici ST99CH_1A5]|uniref:Uncharacterized protein n=1 Tax=Zymoseptoria tritici ST99CH_1A5 TaxID=1276529 RepID=A0A1Y6LHZ0_ZYMTR|nr:unnamed protein product [Zymoseptoria tritici ST99CH_1A5]